MITTAQEDYLRAAYLLREENEAVAAIKRESTEGIRTTDLATRLQVSKPSVTRMVETLKKEGLVKAEHYGRINLTPAGERHAAALTARHRLLEYFLVKKLGLDGPNVHEIAHKMEHALDEETTKRLRAFLGDPKQDPHGRPIPR